MSSAHEREGTSKELRFVYLVGFLLRDTSVF